MVLLSFYSGIWTAKRIFEDNFLIPLTNRIEMLKEFKRYQDIHPVEAKGVEAIKKEVEEELRLKYEKELSEKIDTAKKQIQEQAMELVEDYKKKIDSKSEVA